MADHPSAIKRHKQSVQRRARNRHYRSRMRTQVKAVREAIKAGDVEVAKAELREAMRVLHRAVSKGVIHRNQAARKIGRLSAAVEKLCVCQDDLGCSVDI